MIDEMIEPMVDHLRERAGFLLEAGRDESSDRAVRDYIPAPLTTVAGALDAADTLARLTPRLLEEAAERVLSRDVSERTLRPVRAELARAASAYDIDAAGDWYPRYWLRAAEIHATAPRALRWLAHVVERVDATVAEMQQRFDEQHHEVRVARGELESRWSLEELDRMLENSRELGRARDRLVRTRRAIDLHARSAVHPRERLPRPFPQGPHWRMLRRLLRFWIDPSLSFARHLERSLSAPVLLADLPYLYERWCAIALLDAFEARGWTPANAQKALWVVFLGGRIELANRDRLNVDLWIEPRIGRAGHQCGLVTTGQSAELSPDMVINLPMDSTIESIVLDPTLGLAPEHLEDKGRYARSLRRVEHRTIAGVPVVKHPRRAWAIAPIRERTCRLFGFDETRGVIPLRPGDEDLSPLLAFLDDLLPHVPERPHF